MESEENAEIGCSFGCVPPGLLWGNYVCSFKGPLLKIFRGSFLLVNSNQSFFNSKGEPKCDRRRHNESTAWIAFAHTLPICHYFLI